MAGSIQLYADNTTAVNCSGLSGNTCGKNVENCDSVYLCLPNFPNSYKTRCKDGLTCNGGICSRIKTALCEYGNKNFTCSTLGMYPEPSSCKKFNFCVPNITSPSGGESADGTARSNLPITIPAECEEGWGYNSVTTSCDKPLRNNICADQDRPVPPCLAIGQNGALKGNPTLYYICMPQGDDVDGELYPSILKCPRNTKYAGNYVCK